MSKRSGRRDKKRMAQNLPAPTAQATLVPVAHYDAAGHGRRMRGWHAPSTGPNKAIAGQGTLRNRSRDAGRNEWAAAAAERVWVTNLVGCGIVPRPRTQNAALKASLTALWEAWVKVADADGVYDFYGLQALVTRAWVTAGECFARLRARRLDDGLPVPLQVQVLESDVVPLIDADSGPGLPVGHRIRQGIELDRIGRRVAYWVHRNHPGDGDSRGASLYELSRIPAEEMMHIFQPLRPGQLRGVPESSPVLAKLRGVMDFDDAVLERQKLANLFTLFVTRPPAAGSALFDPITGQPYQLDASGTPMAGLEPGTSHELMPGEDVKFSDPPDAGANYAEFMRQQHIGVAAGQGIPYELLTGDLKDISDRTLRVHVNEFRRQCEQRQWHVLIPMFCERVRAAWVTAALMGGAFRLRDLEAAREVTWTPHGWAYIHPVQDVQARKMEVEAGFRSRSSVINERGDDPDQVDADRATDGAREKRLGLAEASP